MGKSEPQLPIHYQQQQQQEQNQHEFLRFSSRISRLFSFKCVFVLLLSVAVLLTAVFSIFHLHHRRYGFDAKDSIKNSATIQAYFRLQKPVAYLLPQITRLEYDIYAEIGVPYTKVAILSMHKASASNWTHVVFGVLSDPMNSSINPVSLTVIRSSLLELFNRRSNLTLTTSIFGRPSSFEILKFPGGITVIPKQSASFWMLPQALFNFTLPNSLHEIEENFVELKEQLKSGLHLKPYESVYMQVTNKAGSTRDPPVTVQASIMSNLGNLVPLRLKQLAQTITGSPSARNLGLDHSVFGKVKEISLSSYLYHTLDSPSPSPAPSPMLNDYSEPSIPPSPSFSPSPVFSSPSPQNGNDRSLPPIPNAPVDHSCGGSRNLPAPPPMNVPAPRSLPSAPRHSVSPSPVYPRSEMPPEFPPLPAVSYGSHPSHEEGGQKGSVAPSVSVSPSLSFSAIGPLNHITWPLIFFSILVTLQTLCRSADLQFC